MALKTGFMLFAYDEHGNPLGWISRGDGNRTDIFTELVGKYEEMKQLRRDYVTGLKRIYAVSEAEQSKLVFKLFELKELP